MPFDPLLGLGKSLIEAIFPNKTDRLKAEAGLAKIHKSGVLAQIVADSEMSKGQMAVNAVEAAARSLWVAGWRPGVGWACAAGFAYTYVLQPFLVFVLTVMGNPYVHDIPQVDMSVMMPVMMGMLGLAGMRSWDKQKKSVGDGS